MRVLRVSLRERIELIGNPTRRFALIIPNLTVWESLASLRDFAYRGLHRDFFRKRAEWFEAGSLTVVWWIAAGTIPTVDDALARLAFIERFSPSP